MISTLTLLPDSDSKIKSVARVVHILFNVRRCFCSCGIFGKRGFASILQNQIKTEICNHDIQTLEPGFGFSLLYLKCILSPSYSIYTF